LIVGVGTRKNIGNSRFYWKSDILNVAKMLDTHMEDVRMGRPGAQEALDEFRASRVELVTKILKARLFISAARTAQP
jgi:hypothetical protein